MQLPADHRQFHHDVSPDRRAPSQADDRIIGRVVSCSGSRATIAATVQGPLPGGANPWAVGRLVSINLGGSRIVGLVYEMRAQQAAGTRPASIRSRSRSS